MAGYNSFIKPELKLDVVLSILGSLNAGISDGVCGRIVPVRLRCKPLKEVSETCK